MDEYELIQSILSGNQQDFKLLIKKYEANVFRTAIGFLHNKQDAEDITQDVFIKVYQSLSSFNGKAAFSTWLYRITVNSSLNFLRKKKRRGFWVALSELRKNNAKHLFFPGMKNYLIYRSLKLWRSLKGQLNSYCIVQKLISKKFLKKTLKDRKIYFNTVSNN